MATDNVQRPFADILAASVSGVTHLCEVSVFESRSQESSETVCACCAAADNFFPPEALLRLAAELWRSLEASDLDLKAALVRDFPLLYLEVEKVVNTSALSFSKSPPNPPGENRPRRIQVNVPIDLAKMSQLYPELGFYLRFFIDSSSVDLLSLDGKKRLLGLSWNYVQSQLECVCLKRGNHLVWHDPAHLNESMVVAQMKSDIGQTKGNLVGDDVELGPGFECLMRVSLRLRPLGLASVSFSSVDLKLELEDLTPAGVLASLRMVSLEGLLGIGTRLLALEREISESFRVRAGVVLFEEEGRSRSLLGMRGRVSAKRSSIMSWWSAFLMNRVVRAGVSAELLTLLGNLLRAFCSDLKSHLPRQGLMSTPFNYASSVYRSSEGAKDNSSSRTDSTETGDSTKTAGSSDGRKPVVVQNQVLNVESKLDGSSKQFQAASDVIVSEVMYESSMTEPRNDSADTLPSKASEGARSPEVADTALSSVAPAIVDSMREEPSQVAPSPETGAVPPAPRVEPIDRAPHPNEVNKASGIAFESEVVEEALVASTVSEVVQQRETLEETENQSDADQRTASSAEVSIEEKPRTRYSDSDQTTVREVQSFLESIEDLDAYMARK